MKKQFYVEQMEQNHETEKPQEKIIKLYVDMKTLRFD